jgi:hypothetical protein
MAIPRCKQDTLRRSTLFHAFGAHRPFTNAPPRSSSASGNRAAPERHRAPVSNLFPDPADQRSEDRLFDRGFTRSAQAEVSGDEQDDDDKTNQPDDSVHDSTPLPALETTKGDPASAPHIARLKLYAATDRASVRWRDRTRQTSCARLVTRMPKVCEQGSPRTSGGTAKSLVPDVLQDFLHVADNLLRLAFDLFVDAFELLLSAPDHLPGLFLHLAGGVLDGTLDLILVHEISSIGGEGGWAVGHPT